MRGSAGGRSPRRSTRTYSKIPHGALAGQSVTQNCLPYCCLKAQAKGIGVVSLGSKMIDAPVVKRAQNTINTAILSGLLAENWMEEESNG